jgi:uncharacterized protein YbjT (DUF2867 family)
MEDLISVIGATEHIGNVITETLLKRGIKVRAIARNKEKLEKLKSEGAEIFRGDLENTSSTNESLKGSKTIFAMIPPLLPP